MLVRGFPASAFDTNCYVVAPGPGEQCVVVDPGIGVVDRLDDLLREHRLQPVAEALEPSLGAIRDALAGLGPSLDGHLMSGSGSAYFGLARDRDAAEDAARSLGSPGLGLVRVVTCGP